MLLQVTTSLDPRHAYVRAEGEIDLATVTRLRTAIIDALAAGVRDIELDLDAVTYLDSSGLGTLVGAHKRIQALGGTLRVHCTQERVLRLLRITGIDRVLTIEQPDGSAEATPA